MIPYFVDRADVGMIQRGSGPSLAVEAVQSLRIQGRRVREELQSDEAAKRSVLSFIDDAHTTAAESVNDMVMRDSLADKRKRFFHQLVILGGAAKQVNEATRLRAIPRPTNNVTSPTCIDA
jgi:hypothetical protein